jgi:hypothetical protein
MDNSLPQDSIRRDSILRAIDALGNGQLQPPGGCRYVNEDGLPCIAGFLLGPAVARRLSESVTHDGREANGLAVAAVSAAGLLSNAEVSSTGLKFEELSFLQDRFDGRMDVYKILECML